MSKKTTGRKRAFAQGELTTFRKKFGLNQADFWAPLGTTQSAGSRYENTGRIAPESVTTLIELIYGNKPLATLAKLRGVSVEVLRIGK